MHPSDYIMSIASMPTLHLTSLPLKHIISVVCSVPTLYALCECDLRLFLFQVIGSLFSSSSTPTLLMLALHLPYYVVFICFNFSFNEGSMLECSVDSNMSGGACLLSFRSFVLAFTSLAEARLSSAVLCCRRVLLLGCAHVLIVPCGSVSCSFLVICKINHSVSM